MASKSDRGNRQGVHSPTGGASRISQHPRSQRRTAAGEFAHGVRGRVDERSPPVRMRHRPHEGRTYHTRARRELRAIGHGPYVAPMQSYRTRPNVQGANELSSQVGRAPSPPVRRAALGRGHRGGCQDDRGDQGGEYRGGSGAGKNVRQASEPDGARRRGDELRRVHHAQFEEGDGSRLRAASQFAAAAAAAHRPCGRCRTSTGTCEIFHTRYNTHE
mmetsp:Transcript_23863/g.57541  ORF Transcript_23863/g.57541 Transcript_23863/m.57541 type:complete len:217 (+) Transcript_23863:1720-2370(+)